MAALCLPLGAALAQEQRLSTSQYLATTRAWVSYEMHYEIVAGRFGLSLRAPASNPADLWLQAWFSLPPSDTRNSGLLDTPDPPLVDVAAPLARIAPGREITIESPVAEHLRCRPYLVAIQVYADETQRQLLGEHRQPIRGKVNGMKVRSESELGNALRAPGACAPP